MTFLGSLQTSTLTAVAAPGLGETLGSIVQGLTYQLGISTTYPFGRKNLSTLLAKVGATTTVASVDYTFDPSRGELYIIPGGTVIVSGSSLVLTYGQVATSIDQVISGNTSFEGAAKFVADNNAGTNFDYYMPWVRITPNGEYQLKAENAVQALSYNMKILKRSGLAAFYVNGQAY